MRILLFAMVAMSGMAGLSWELLWQHYASLAIGISAIGTAVTLAITMAGLAAGSVLMGRYLRLHGTSRPLQLYGGLELIIGVAGLFIGAGFGLVETLDSLAYRYNPALTPLVQAAGMILLVGPPTIAMGATIPLFTVLAPQYATSIGSLYALNTAGACGGVLIAAFGLLPTFGVSLTGIVVGCLNIFVFLLGMLGERQSVAEPATGKPRENQSSLPINAALTYAFTTGFVTFGLEVSWFRSLRAAFQSTTDSFALILVSVLLALALGARIAVSLPRNPRTIIWLTVTAGILVLLMTPVISKLDHWSPMFDSYWTTRLVRLGLCVATMGIPMTIIGTALPWLLEEFPSPRRTSQLYAINTVGAVIGSLTAAWWLLPMIGAEMASILLGLTLVAVACVIAKTAIPNVLLVSAAAALAIALTFHYNTPKRVQGAHLLAEHTVLDSREGPDATVSVIEHQNGVRELVIDGFQTSGEATSGHYMAWMGHLPMMLHPNPQRALVICFGTGQTANAVRKERPRHLDIVELSDAVIEMASLFPSNEQVLEHSGVSVKQMDGRAWLRRTQTRYDVVTLEPMAPYFAGTNSLYSKEFYELVKSRANPGAVIAQWLPFHLVSPHDSAAIARTFQAVFSESLLWIDPIDRTGILIGRHGVAPEPSQDTRTPVQRDLTLEQVSQGFRLNPRQLEQYGEMGPMITDDNQQLSYGPGRYDAWSKFHDTDAVHRFNLDIVSKVAAGEL